MPHATVDLSIRGSCPGGAVPAAHSYVAEDRLRTLGGLFFALQVEGEGSAVSGTSSSQLVDLLANTTYVSRVVLVILALFSVASWAVILYKVWMFRQAERQTGQFLDVFRRSNKFSEVQAVCQSLGNSPLVGLFQSGYAELTAQLRQSGTAEVAGNPQPVANRPTLKSLTAVDRSLTRASVVELNKLEQRIPLLATTASVAPFIGLFGTVWGIMMAFLNIGETGSTSLEVVGVPIAEALIATAFGLAAAIPALVAYNHFSNRVKLFASEMDDFSMEFLNIAERNFT
jgi:biopolymer transport protein TolQ